METFQNECLNEFTKSLLCASIGVDTEVYKTWALLPRSFTFEGNRMKVFLRKGVTDGEGYMLGRKVYSFLSN